MLQNYVVKVTLGSAMITGKSGLPQWRLRFDFDMPVDGYEKIDPKLAKLVGLMMDDGEERIKAQLQWQVSETPCVLRFAPNREALLNDQHTTILGEVAFKPKIIVVKRKADDPEEPLQTILLATTVVPANKRTAEFVLNHYEKVAWCKIETPQQETVPDDEDDNAGE